MAATAHNGGMIHPGEGASMGALLGGIVTDLEVLMRQEIALASHEIRDEVDDAAASVLGLAVGVMSVALGLMLAACGASLALARWLAWPTWEGLAAVGGGLTVVGLMLFTLFSRRVSTLRSRPWRRRPKSSGRR